MVNIFTTNRQSIPHNCSVFLCGWDWSWMREKNGTVEKWAKFAKRSFLEIRNWSIENEAMPKTRSFWFYFQFVVVCLLLLLLLLGQCRSLSWNITTAIATWYKIVEIWSMYSMKLLRHCACVLFFSYMRTHIHTPKKRTFAPLQKVFGLRFFRWYASTFLGGRLEYYEIPL